MDRSIEECSMIKSDSFVQYPRNPACILLRVYKQLSSTVEMMRTLSNKDTKHLYREAKAILKSAMEKISKSLEKSIPDITPLTKAEHSIRDLFLALLSNYAYIQGVEEPKRIYDHRDTVGTLNQGYNALGAVIREQFCSWYPFPDPELFGHKKGSDKRKIPRMGYKGGQTGTVLATHIYQVSMDFQDVIRDHERLLNLYLTINQVPVQERRRFFILFLLRMKPHIDYLFSERECGLPGFEKRARTILKELRDLSKALFIQRNGIESTVTGTERKPKKKPTAKSFFNSIIKNSGANIIELDKKGIESCIEKMYFTDEDVIHLYEDMEKTARIRGSQLHDRIKQKLARTTQLRKAIFQGDELTDDPEWLICSELPLDTQQGKDKADLTVFKRISGVDNRRANYLPVAVYDTKTKTGFDIEVETEIRKQDKKSKPSKLHILPKFKTPPRTLTQKEWVREIAITPDSDTITQLRTYAQSIGNTYRSITGDSTMADPLTGTVLMDSSERFSEHRPHFTKVLVDVTKNVLDKTAIERTLYSPEIQGKSSKTGIIVHKQVVPESLRKESSIRSWTPLYNPLESSKYNEQRFILYLSENLNGSGGISGAWIARYYHLIQFLLELRASQPDTKILWLDCADEFSESESIGETRGLGPEKMKRTAYSKSAILTLARTRLRLSDHKELSSEDTTNLFNSIQFIPLFDDLYSHIIKEKEFDSLSKQLQSGKEHQIVIVSGMDKIERAIPSYFTKRFYAVKRDMIRYLTARDEDIIIWNDSPKQTGKPAILYNRKTLLPFYNSSPLYGVVNEILWNLPIRPAKPPYYYHTRGVIHQTVDGFKIGLISVPPLYDWGRRFKNRSPRKPEEFIMPSTRVRVRMKGMLLTLIPWLVELHPEQEITTGNKEHTAQDILSRIQIEQSLESKDLSVKSTLLKKTESKSGLSKRVTFKSKTSKGGKGHVTSVFKSINTSRAYYQHRQYSLSPPDTSPRPPRKRYLHPPERIALEDVFLREWNYLLSTVSILLNIDKANQIIQFIDGVLSRNKDHLALIESVHGFLFKHKETSEVWKRITQVKEKAELEILTPEQAEGLRGAFESEPNLLAFCGLHRSVMLLWLLLQYTQLNDDDIQWFNELLRSWTLLQLGFVEKYPKGHITGLSEYDILTLWDDLADRAKIRSSLPKPRNNRIRFGVGFELRNAPYDWIVLEDTTPSRRLLSGLFKRDDLENIDDQIIWSVSRLDVVQSMCSDIDFHQYTKYMFVKYDKGWFAYRWNEYMKAWSEKGILVTISRGSPAELGLRGVSFQSKESPSGKEHINEEYEFKQFVSQAKDELDRIKHNLQGIKHVRLSLGVDGSNFRVDFIEPASKKVIHTITILASVDLIRLLRWPLKEGRGLNLRSGDRVTWNPLSLDDIDYGALTHFRPLLRTSKTDATAFTVPTTLKGVSFKIEVVHDDLLCPVINDASDEHGACWRLRHSGVWPKEFTLKDGSARGFTDEEVYDIIGTRGTIGKKMKPEWKFVQGFTQGERIVFNTSRAMRELMFEREGGIRTPQPYPPKLYRAYRKMRWRVSLKMEGLRVIWETSHSSGFRDIKKDSGEIDVDSSIPVDVMVEIVVANISKQIPTGKLADIQSVKHRLRMILGSFYSSSDKASGCPEHIQKEVTLIEKMGGAEDVLKVTPSQLFFRHQHFIILASFYHDQGRFSEGIATLDRVFRYIEDTDTSAQTNEIKIEVLELKGRLLKELGKRDEMRGILQQILTIGESISDPLPKTKKILLEVENILNGEDFKL